MIRIWEMFGKRIMKSKFVLQYGPGFGVTEEISGLFLIWWCWHIVTRMATTDTMGILKGIFCWAIKIFNEMENKN